MGVDKGKKQKLEENNAMEHIDSDLLLSIEKLQQAQDELEKIRAMELARLKLTSQRTTFMLESRVERHSRMFELKGENGGQNWPLCDRMVFQGMRSHAYGRKLPRSKKVFYASA